MDNKKRRLSSYRLSFYTDFFVDKLTAEVGFYKGVMSFYLLSFDISK